MTLGSPVKLLATIRPEGIAWEIRDDDRRLGHGSCATIDELRGVEVRAGIAVTEVSGRAMSFNDLRSAREFGWVVAEDAA